ncbi:hypothetical protein WMY93_001600 [Mugilogobius chulae]|uniref:NID domain-containing protein n=1 Tax=Mugilogobius chulae TaxID=88201 RepID=A0AAW0PTV8_9GOBI
MSSDEDFSLVVDPSEETLDGLRALIEIEKSKHAQLLDDQAELTHSISETQGLNQQFKSRAVTLQQDMDQDQDRGRDQEAQDQERVKLMQKEELEIRQELDRVSAQLQEEETTMERLRAQADVFSGAPERSLVFQGVTGKPQDGVSFLMEPTVEYPMEGGTALITFEEATVAQRVVSKRRHKVDLGGEFYINVEARAVPITVPSSVQDPGLKPASDGQSYSEDKLYIHFSKTRHGGEKWTSATCSPRAELQSSASSRTTSPDV